MKKLVALIVATAVISFAADVNVTSMETTGQAEMQNQSKTVEAVSSKKAAKKKHLSSKKHKNGAKKSAKKAHKKHKKHA